MSLNSQYFDKLHTELLDEYKYDIYRPKDNPIILFSKLDGSPLASLHLRCQNN